VTTEKPTKEQLAKLPVWAQQAFASLDRELLSAKQTVAAMRVALNEMPPEGASGIVTWSNLDEDFALPDRCDVRFHDGGFGDKAHGRYIEVGFSGNDEDGRVVMVRGSGSIVIQPQAGNVIAVRLERGAK
jgi:hypothetical protein